MSEPGLWFAALGASLGFLIGYSVGQASTCAVTAAKEIVFEGRARLFSGFLLASGVAGLLCLPLAWTIGMRAGLPPEAPIAIPLIAGALLLATGALVNDACLFGTLARIALGEVRFLAVPIGLAIGFGLTHWLDLGQRVLTPNMFGHPGPAAVALVLVSGAIVAAAVISLARGGDPGAPGLWPLRLSMVVLGGAGALLFVLTPGWTYSDSVRRGVFSLDEMFMPLGAAVIATGLATLTGSVVAGIVARRFVFQSPRPLPILRSLAGGALMAIGASFVPGGNDNLLLWAVPGGSLSGLIAYATMSVTIVAVFIVQKFLTAPAAQ